jgi:glycosyltransferase involved in cell wall biosynthesis
MTRIPVTPELSVVIPVRNEAASLVELHRELTETLTAWGRPYEIIVVEDGSSDDSYTVLSRLQALDPHLRVIRFRRNFGQTAAFAAGFDHARGRLIATSDGDLQNDPHDIPRMIELLDRGGYDIVCGWRRSRKDPFLSRRLPSMIANRVISVATGVALHDYGCSLKIFRAEVVKPLKLYGEMHRFLPAIASEQGVSIAEMVVNHRERRYGRSNYGIGRTIRVILDLLTVKFLLSYSTRPVQIFGLIGFAMGLPGAAILAWLAYVKLVGHEAIGNRPLLSLGILLAFTGVQLVTLGLLAEMQARTYHESQRKPTYAIREILEESPRAEGPRSVSRL